MQIITILLMLAVLTGKSFCQTLPNANPATSASPFITTTGKSTSGTATRPAPEKPFAGIADIYDAVPEEILPKEPGSWTDVKISAANDVLADKVKGRIGQFTFSIEQGTIQMAQPRGREPVRWMLAASEQRIGTRAFSLSCACSNDLKLQLARLNVGDRVVVSAIIIDAHFERRAESVPIVIHGDVIRIVSVANAAQGTSIAATQPASREAIVAKFFGAGLQGSKIVIIIDHSGSMLDSFDFVKAEAKRAIDALDSTQSIAVVMVSDRAEFAGDAKLQLARPDVKKKIADAIGRVQAEGQNDQLLAPFQSAFERAFALKPGRIVFLTDGRFDERLAGIVRKLNTNRAVTVDTVAFIQEEADFKEQMVSLAKDNGGEYHFVGEAELKIGH